MSLKTSQKPSSQASLTAHLRTLFVIGIICTLPILYASPAQAAFFNDPRLDWQTLHSEHFEIHYHDGEAALARKAADIAERAHVRLTQYFDWTPASKTQIVLTDRMDFSNGSATPLPYNEMNLIVTPPDDVTFIDNYDDYLDLLITHEYTHVVHIDKVRGVAGVFRKIFGRVDWLFPNAWQPAWVVEGIATYQESQLKDGVGRGSNSLYRGMMRNEIVNGLKPLRQVNQPTTDWPMGTTRYLYGVYYFNFIKSKYGDEGIKRWVYHYSDNVIPFVINNTSAHAFGKQLDGMWYFFNKYLDEQFQADIEQRRQQGLTQSEQISTTGYYTGYPHVLANGDLYYIQQGITDEAKLMRLRKGESKPEELTEVHGDRFDIHPDKGIVIAELDLDYSTNVFSDLHIIDLNTLEDRQITHSQRYVFATWNPNGEQIAAVHNEAGEKRLDLLDDNGELIQTLWRSERGEILSNPQWSPDGSQIVAAVWRPENGNSHSGNWDLESFSLQTQQWHKLTSDPALEIQPIFSNDGNSILYSADYDGSFNIYQLKLSDHSILQLTNEMGGAMAATSAGSGKDVYYMALGKQGYNVYRVTREHLFNKPHVSAAARTAETQLHSNRFIKTAATPEPVLSAPDNNHAGRQKEYPVTPYYGLDKLLPRSWFPYLVVDEDRAELGASTFGADPLYRHLYDVLFAYDVKNNWSLGGFDYIYDRWNPSFKVSGFRTILADRNNDDKLMGFRSSDAISAEFIVPLLKRDRQWAFHLGFVEDKEKTKLVELPEMPEIDSQDQIVGLAVTYNSSKRYIRSISRNDGQLFRLVYEDSDILKSDFTGQVATLDWRGYFRMMGENVFATRVVIGHGNDNPSPFRLGGTVNGFQIATPGNTIVAPTDSVFNRREYALRGYPAGLPALRGRRMALIDMEWRMPLLRLERGYMTPPIGLHQVYGSVFYNAGEAWYDSLDSDEIRKGTGFEFNSELILGYGLELDLRLGYAHGFDKGGDDQVYLKVGKTF